MRYGENKAYKIEDTTSGTDDSPKNKNDTPIQQDYVIIHHYYHKITKKYLVVANETDIIYK
jgi:hypothetical protein